MVPLSIDAALSQFRWVVARRIEEEQQAAGASGVRPAQAVA
jgi:vanillate O-demethylase monooxygenase subunit